MQQHSFISANLAVASIRLIINSSFLCRLVIVPLGRRLIKERDSIMSKIRYALPLLSFLTNAPPQSVLCLLKSPTMISLINGNLLLAREAVSEIC